MGAYDYEKEKNRIAVLERLLSEETGESVFRRKLCRELIHSHIRAIFWESRESGTRSKEIAETHIRAMEDYFSMNVISAKMKITYCGVKYVPDILLKLYKVFQEVKGKNIYRKN